MSFEIQLNKSKALHDSNYSDESLFVLELSRNCLRRVARPSHYNVSNHRPCCYRIAYSLLLLLVLVLIRHTHANIQLPGAWSGHMLFDGKIGESDVT